MGVVPKRAKIPLADGVTEILAELIQAVGDQLRIVGMHVQRIPDHFFGDHARRISARCRF